MTIKTVNIKPYFFPLKLLTLLILISNYLIGQTTSDTKNNVIIPFQVAIINSDYAMSYSVQISLTDKQIKIVYKSGLEGGKDTLLFSKNIQPSDTLKQISEIDLSKLKHRYSNDCIEDGSQITVILKRGNTIKSVHLSNYFQDDIGKIIYLINSLVPEKYKVWYNKEKLIAEYKKCHGIK